MKTKIIISKIEGQGPKQAIFKWFHKIRIGIIFDVSIQNTIDSDFMKPFKNGLFETLVTQNQKIVNEI